MSFFAVEITEMQIYAVWGFYVSFFYRWEIIIIIIINHQLPH